MRCAVANCPGIVDGPPWMCKRCQVELGAAATEHWGTAVKAPGGATPCRVDPDRWHPEPEDRETRKEAILICLTACPVLQGCREHAEAVGPQHGVWGGEWWHGGRSAVQRSRARRDARVAAVG